MDATPPGSSEPELFSPVNPTPDPSVIAMDTLPSDSDPPVPEPSQQEIVETTPDPSDQNNHHPDCPLSTTRTPPTNGTSSTTTSRRTPAVMQPSVQTLANLLDEVIRVNTRLQPCLERCRDLIRSDPALSGRDGANSNNENVADSSSQTEIDADEVPSSSTMETEVPNSNSADETPNSSETRNSSEESTLNGGTRINAQINVSDISDIPLSHERARLEGLAHAVLSAAFATAVAATGNAVSSDASTNTPRMSTAVL
ncbi:UNVERIFIED_CONTAM: hypothetical protein NCL1_39581 [Trichonephila clavipes]